MNTRKEICYFETGNSSCALQNRRYSLPAIYTDFQVMFVGIKKMEKKKKDEWSNYQHEPSIKKSSGFSIC